MVENRNGEAPPQSRRTQAGNRTRGYGEGNVAIQAWMQKLKWEQHDGYYSADIPDNFVDRIHKFFETKGKELRNDGVEFADIEKDGSRIVTTDREDVGSRTKFQHEIRLSDDDMKALDINPARRER